MSCYVVLYYPTSVIFDLIFVTSCDAILRKMSYRSREVISFFNHRICCVIFFQVIFIHVVPCLSYLSREIMTCYHTFIVWFYMVFVLNVSTHYLIPSCLVLFFISSHRTSQLSLCHVNCIKSLPEPAFTYHLIASRFRHLFYPQQRVSMGLTVSCKTAKEFSH